jgi:phosphoglycerate dehydrogenase-like enzyme
MDEQAKMTIGSRGVAVLRGPVRHPDRVEVWIPYREQLDALGALPGSIHLSVWDGRGPTPGDPAQVEVWVPPFLPGPDVVAQLPNLTGLRLLQLMSAGAEAWVDHVPAGVTLCDARGVHTGSTSEWVVTAILASLRQFPRFALAQGTHRWDHTDTDTLAGKRVLIVGAGDIGEAVYRRLEPFGVILVRVARRRREGVYPVTDLPWLLLDADVVVLLVPLTAATRGMVDSRFLARMRDGALLVNAARGAIVDTAALLAELQSRRLRAALDVTDPEPLPADHPLWDAPGLLLTPHVAGSVHGVLAPAYQLVGDQLRRYAAGEAVQNVVTDGY